MREREHGGKPAACYFLDVKADGAGGFVGADVSEWRFLWNQIKRSYGDVSCENHGEVWQYMGTWRSEEGRWHHQLRHRLLPPKNERVYARVTVTTWFRLAVEQGFIRPVREVEGGTVVYGRAVEGRE